MVADEPEFVPDVYPEAAVFDDCPSPEMVKVRTDTDGDGESVADDELPGVDVEEPEPAETGIVSTVADPDGSVIVRTVAELGPPPVVLVLADVLPEPDKVLP